MTVLTATAEAEESDASDRGAAPRGASGVILVPGEKPSDKPKPREVTMPRLLRFAEAQYPAKARDEGREAEVVLELTIDAQGKVQNAMVRRSGGHGFDEAARAAAPRLEFEPARTKADGKAVPAKILFQYEFKLQPADAAPKRPANVEIIGGTVLSGDVPLAQIAVTLKLADGTERTVRTDDQGRFSFVDLPPGNYRVVIQTQGFEPFTATEKIGEDEAITVRYRLQLSDEPGAGLEVIVQGERPQREVTRRTIERRELDRIPGTKGDALRALENMPGVARPPPFVGLLIIRGSAPEDSQTYIDGTAVPLIFHFGGLASVVPTELLERIDFYPGNFRSKYGRAMGGAVDVVLRSPRTDDYHGLAQLDFIDGRLQLEGPIPLLDDWGFLMAGRRSWIDALLTPVINGAGLDVVQTPAYYDYQFMLENKPDPDARLRATFYGSDDGFEIAGGDVDEKSTGSFDLHIAFMRGQLSYDAKRPGGDHASWMMAFGRDIFDFSFRTEEFGDIFFQTEILSVHNRVAYRHEVNEQLAFNIGADVLGGVATVATRLPAPKSKEEQEGRPGKEPFAPIQMEVNAYDRSFLQPAAYFELEYTPFRHFSLVPGLRFDHTLPSNQLDISPRLNASWGLFEGYPQTTIKAAIGLYYQQPPFIKTIGPDANPDLESSRAIHYGLGLVQDITRELELSVEGFIKRLDNLAVTLASSTMDTNDGVGHAAGGELLAKFKPNDRFFGWLAYTLSQSVRRDAPDLQPYHPEYDQTHIFTVLGSVRLGDGWEFGARFRIVSGNLVTPTICEPTDDGCDGNIVNSIYHAPSASYIPFPGPPDNSERLPLFHQLDVRVDKTWDYDWWKLSLYIDILNVYNHAAAEGVSYSFNYAQRQYFSGLPVIPSIGLRGQF